MTVTPTKQAESAAQQLRLLSPAEPITRSARARRRVSRRPGPQPSVWLDARTREIGQTGIAEARRRLAEINRPPSPLVQAS